MQKFPKKSEHIIKKIIAVSSGKIIPIEDVKDEVFSQKILGDGCAILPLTNNIVAPCDGKVSMLFPTFHAVGITTDSGLEILIHIGINTVNLSGHGFKSCVNQDDFVKQGDPLIMFNLRDLRKKGYDMTIMIIYPNCKEKIEIIKSDFAIKGRTVIAKLL